jgi:hypothetical protein
MGPMKRGKTWWLMEFAFHALSFKRRVAYISLEMNDKKCSKRFYQRLTAAGKEDKFYAYHVYDCEHNQANQCNRGERACRTGLNLQIENPNYIPCTACKGIHLDYEAAFFQVETERPELTSALAHRASRLFLNQFGRNHFRAISYPPFTANLKNIQNDLDVLVYGGFIPDVVVIDYADILAPEGMRSDVRHQIDDTWKTLKGMAAERKIAVITATQGNRASLQKDLIEQTDVSEDIRKLAHPDIFFALSQSKKEKQVCALRLNMLAHRWQHFDPYQNLQIMYNFNLGQPMLDSLMVEYNPQEDAPDARQRQR